MSSCPPKKSTLSGAEKWIMQRHKHHDVVCAVPHYNLSVHCRCDIFAAVKCITLYLAPLADSGTAITPTLLLTIKQIGALGTRWEKMNFPFLLWWYDFIFSTNFLQYNHLMSDTSIPKLNMMSPSQPCCQQPKQIGIVRTWRWWENMYFSFYMLRLWFIFSN